MEFFMPRKKRRAPISATSCSHKLSWAIKNTATECVLHGTFLNKEIHNYLGELPKELCKFCLLHIVVVEVMNDWSDQSKVKQLQR
jgi:hypothetical protein